MISRLKLLITCHSDVNGNKIYAIPTTEEFWHDKQMDGRHWTFTTTSSKKVLDDKRKFGTCQGSLIFMNPQCPVFTTEGICNQIDFAKHKFEGHVCNSCGYLATRIFFGCIKVTEFNQCRRISLQYGIKVNISVT